MRFDRPETLAEFQLMFGHIYGEVNAGYRDTELILRILEEVGVAMELARKDRRDEFRVQLPRIFSWTMALANRLNVDMQTALWHKYPGVCSYCMRDHDCMCGTEHPVILDKEDTLRRLRRERKGREPILVNEHQALHKRLYGWQNERIMLIQVAAHLAEEAGEVSHDFRHNDHEGLAGELADVFSWMFGFASRLAFDLGDIVWERYPFECEDCRCDKCQCEQLV